MEGDQSCTRQTYAGERCPLATKCKMQRGPSLREPCGCWVPAKVEVMACPLRMGPMVRKPRDAFSIYGF